MFHSTLGMCFAAFPRYFLISLFLLLRCKGKTSKETKTMASIPLLEVIYGGWTLVRATILPAFTNCKDIEFLTLLNLIDNYVPLVLSIYSAVFKCSNCSLYSKSLFGCWIMMMTFHRRHCDKALLIVLSVFKNWQENTHPMHGVIQQFLVALDEYPVENFHSVLRTRTGVSDTANQIREKSKAIDVCKKKMHEFQSLFVPLRKFIFCQKKINNLKTKAAEFLVSKFKIFR